jgi:hypothetical protein
MATTSNPLTDIANAAKAAAGALTGGNNLTQQVTGVKAATPQSNVATVGQAAAAVAGAPAAAVSAGESAVNTADTAIGSVEDFLQGLTSANLWIRIAKVIAGGAILLIGLAKITGASEKAGSIAAKAVRVAPLL